MILLARHACRFKALRDNWSRSHNFCVRLRLSSERSERAVNKKRWYNYRLKIDELRLSLRSAQLTVKIERIPKFDIRQSTIFILYNMPDILLIQPPIRDFYLTAKRTIPYGLACMAPALINSGFTVKILDSLATSKSRVCDLPKEMSYLRKYYDQPDRSAFALFHQYRHYGYSFGHIGKIAKESGAFLVGISSLFTPYLEETLQTAETVKAFHRDCKIVVGGHHPSAMPESVMASEAVDFVIRGEGEVSLHRLAEAVAGDGAYDSIPGLVFRQKNGALRINPPARMDHPDEHPRR